MYLNYEYACMNLSETIFSYNSASGKSGVRSFIEEEILYFSLFDVVKAISAENKVLEPSSRTKSLINLIKAHVTHLLPDEIKHRNNLTANLDEPLKECYVTKAGLLRVVLQDNSPACIKFQKWVLDDVLPQVLETGSYKQLARRSSSELISGGGFDVETMLRLQLQETIERKEADERLKSEVAKISSKVAMLEKSIDSSEYLLVSNYEKADNFDPKQLYEFFTICLNLCSVDRVYKARRIHKGDDIDSKEFTLQTLEAAFSEWNRSMKRTAGN